MTRKVYVLDTSALITDPQCFKNIQFKNTDVVIPIAVLNELDNLKKGFSGAAKNARVAIRKIDEVSDLGDISTGILLDHDILLKVDTAWLDLTEPQYNGLGSATYGDTQILACLIDNWNNHPTKDVSLISNDINLRIKAKSRSISAESYEKENISVNELYTGLQTVVNEEAGEMLLQEGWINPVVYDLKLFMHEGICFQTFDGTTIATGRKVANNKVKLIKKYYPWGLSPRNEEQTFLIDMLMDPGIDLVSTLGLAGSGKTLCVLAAALELVINKRQYDKLIIYRPIQPVGSDIGFLPGTITEKLEPWFASIMDNLEVLFTNNDKKGSSDWKRDLEMFQKKGKIEMECLTYIRGRTLPRVLVIFDECQSLSTEEVKTLLTRMGDNSKIVLTGDNQQIDRSDLDAVNNGLVYVIEKFKESELSGHVTLFKGERSRLATKATELL
jgi:PhoH-like ATPase